MYIRRKVWIGEPNREVAAIHQFTRQCADFQCRPHLLRHRRLFGIRQGFNYRPQLLWEDIQLKLRKGV